MNEDDYVLVLWDIYLSACMCASDITVTGCECSASDKAGQALEEVLGADWHQTMRLRTGVA
jgi:hypothetical protein